MANRGQTHAKREREVALRERRERKRAKKAEAATQRTAGDAVEANSGIRAPEVEGRTELAATEWIQ
jgi:hypothetical protein